MVVVTFHQLRPETLIAESSEWVEAGALPSARDGLRGATIDNQFYVLGKC